MTNYALIDKSGNINDIVEWDGVTPYVPLQVDGVTTYNITVNQNYSIGGTLINGVYTAPAVTQTQHQD